MSIVGNWLRTLKRDVVAVWIAARDPRVRWAARLLAGATAAYALSPIDLVPDFIPVLGWLDDILIVGAGLWLVVRLIPIALMEEFRDVASRRADRPRSLIAAGVVALIWLGILAAAARIALDHQLGVVRFTLPF